MEEIMVQTVTERPYFMSSMDDTPVIHLSTYAPDWITIIAFLILLVISLIACSQAPENRKTALSLGIAFLGCSAGMVIFHAYRVIQVYLLDPAHEDIGAYHTDTSILELTAPSFMLIAYVILLLFIWAVVMLCFFYKKAVRKVWKGQK